MPIERAKELLKNSDNSLEDLLNCLEQLSESRGYTKAAKKVGLYHSETAQEIITELEFYIEQITTRIKKLQLTL